MNLEEAIPQSEKWLIASGDLVDGISVKSEDRYRIAASLFHLSMEHHGGIHLLIVKKLYGSSFALLRPQLEAYIRGLWFHHCANDNHIANYKKDKEPPRIDKLIKNIEAIPGFEKNTLSQMKNNAWTVLCGYTHGGFYQVVNRNTQTEIRSDYAESKIIDLLNQASSITLLVLAALASLIKSEEFAIKALMHYDEIFNDQQA